jgi:NADH dehydrogenase FAD-containing subunit
MTPIAAQSVVVAGGGIGGVATANRLRRRLDRRHRVVLVNRDPDFTFPASYLWVMTGSRRPEQITRPLKGLERRGIEVVIGDVTDTARRWHWHWHWGKVTFEQRVIRRWL